MYKVTTHNSKQTQNLGEMLAKEIKNGIVICLSGDLGCGKTTFTQGLLRGLKIRGPYTSPTFVIMKKYRISQNVNRKSIRDIRYAIRDIYHIDAYRVHCDDVLSLGWKEMISDEKNIVIVEWAQRIKKIIPKNALWIKFKWLDENEREIEFT